MSGGQLEQESEESIAIREGRVAANNTNETGGLNLITKPVGYVDDSEGVNASDSQIFKNK